MISDRQRRQSVISQLMGLSFVIKQSYVSRYEAYISSDYHEWRWRLRGCPEKSLDLEEARRWQHQSENLVLEIAKNRKSLSEALGLVIILFPKTEEVAKLVAHLHHLRAIHLEKPPEEANDEKLRRWKTKSLRTFKVWWKITLEGR